MDGTCKRRRRGSRGQTLVEFALGLPLIILLTLGMIDLARAVYYYNTLSDIARDGARFGIVLTDPGWETIYGQNPWTVPGNQPGTTPYIMRDYVGTNTIVGNVAKRAGVLDASQTKVTITVTGTPDAHLRLPLTVKVEYPFTPSLLYLLGGQTFNLMATSMMRAQ